MSKKLNQKHYPPQNVALFQSWARENKFLDCVQGVDPYHDLTYWYVGKKFKRKMTCGYPRGKVRNYYISHIDKDNEWACSPEHYNKANKPWLIKK
jgi:hypothetical protein